MTDTTNMGIYDQLATFGFAVKENALSNAECQEVEDRLEAVEEARRKKGTLFQVDGQTIVYCLHENDPWFCRFIDHPGIFPHVKEVLNNGQVIILNSLSASKSLRAAAGDGDALIPHIDGRMPTTSMSHTVSVNCMLCVNDFKVENGALVVWPRSHMTGSRPPRLPWRELSGYLVCTVPRGSVIFWLGQTWHMIGKNVTGERRWGLIGHYTYWFIKPSFDYTACGPDLWSRMTLQQKVLCGFTSMPPKSADRRVFTVTDPAKLPSEYADVFERVAGKDFSSFTRHEGLDAKV